VRKTKDCVPATTGLRLKERWIIQPVLHTVFWAWLERPVASYRRIICSYSVAVIDRRENMFVYFPRRLARQNRDCREVYFNQREEHPPL